MFSSASLVRPMYVNEYPSLKPLCLADHHEPLHTGRRPAPASETCCAMPKADVLARVRVARQVCPHVACHTVPVTGPDRVQHAVNAPVQQPHESAELRDPVHGAVDHVVLHGVVDVVATDPGVAFLLVVHLEHPLGALVGHLCVLGAPAVSEPERRRAAVLLEVALVLSLQLLPVGLFAALYAPKVDGLRVELVHGHVAVLHPADRLLHRDIIVLRKGETRLPVHVREHREVGALEQAVDTLVLLRKCIGSRTASTLEVLLLGATATSKRRALNGGSSSSTAAAGSTNSATATATSKRRALNGGSSSSSRGGQSSVGGATVCKTNSVVVVGLLACHYRRRRRCHRSILSEESMGKESGTPNLKPGGFFCGGSVSLKKSFLEGCALQTPSVP